MHLPSFTSLSPLIVEEATLGLKSQPEFTVSTSVQDPIPSITLCLYFLFLRLKYILAKLS